MSEAADKISAPERAGISAHENVIMFLAIRLG
jgi:hypothetical protein